MIIIIKLLRWKTICLQSPMTDLFNLSHGKIWFWREREKDGWLKEKEIERKIPQNENTRKSFEGTAEMVSNSEWITFLSMRVGRIGLSPASLLIYLFIWNLDQLGTKCCAYSSQIENIVSKIQRLKVESNESSEWAGHWNKNWWSNRQKDAKELIQSRNTSIVSNMKWDEPMGARGKALFCLQIQQTEM